MAGRFAEHVVWITGASAGLGRAMALELAREGAHLALSARRVDRLEEVAQEVRALGRRALVVPCDTTDEAQVAESVRVVTDDFGKLDVAIANAGFAVGGPVERLSADDWRRQLDVNVVGAAVTARHAIPHLEETRGRLALVGSVSGVIYLPGAGAYQASKAAVLALGSTLAAELHPRGVSCTTLQPGFVRSEIGQVDNQGRFDEGRADRRPAMLLWETDDAARVMVRAIHRRRRVYTFTGHGRIGAFVGRHLPWVAHLVGRRMAATR